MGHPCTNGDNMERKKYEHTEIILTRVGYNILKREICNQKKVVDNE